MDSIIEIFESKKYNKLQSVYLRAMAFYSNSLKGSEFSKEDISFKLLNILIAAETLLVFSTRGAKKNKLAHIIVGLLEIPEAEKPKYIKSIIEAYSDRSNLVHSGNQNLSKYIVDSMTEKKKAKV